MIDQRHIDEQERAVRDLLRSRGPKRGIFGRAFQFLVYAVLGIVGIVVLSSLFGGDPTDLQVELVDFMLPGDRRAFRVTNIGHQPVAITNVIFNENKDCRIHDPVFSHQESYPFPIKLDVGGVRVAAAGCRIVRMTIVTTNGQEDFSFTR